MAGTYVQHDHDAKNSGDLSLTLTGVTAGNTLILVCGWGGYTGGLAITLSGISSDNGGAFTQAVLLENQNWRNGCIFYLENCNSGTHNVTVDMTGANSHYGQALLFEYSGLETSSVLAGANSGNSSSATSIGSGNITTSQACLFLGNGTHNSSTAGLSHSLSGGTERAENTDSSSYMPYSVVESAGLASGTYSNTFTKAGSATEISTVLAAFKESAGGGGSTYNETVTLAAYGLHTLAPSLIMGESMTLAANLAQGPAPSNVMVPGVSFAATAQHTLSNQLLLQAVQVLAAQASVSWLHTLTQSDGITLASQADFSLLHTATMNALTLYLAEVSHGLSSVHTINETAALAMQAAVNWSDEIAGIVEAVQLAAVASQSQEVTAIMNAVNSLSALAAQVHAASLTASSLVSLPAGATLSSLDVIEGIVAALSFGVQTNFSAVATAEIAGQLTLSLQAIIQSQATSIANGLLALGVTADLAHAGGMAIMEGVAFQVQAALMQAAAATSPEFGNILRVVAWSLTMPTVTGEVMRPAGPVEEVLTI